MRFYVDTSVWLDYFKDRGNGIRPLGEFAFRFLKKCQTEKNVIIVSDIVVYELGKHIPEEQVKQIFSPFLSVIVEVKHTKEQAEEAIALSMKLGRVFPTTDLLHSIIARDEGSILVTRDKHFKEIGLVETAMPEDLV